jgi:ribonuclease HII
LAVASDRFDFERLLRSQGLNCIAGVDEAGRGPLAGPVVAAAVMFAAGWMDGGMPSSLSGLNDSKQLSASRRERFFELLTTDAGVSWFCAEVSVAEIDEMNILRATHLAMRRAVAGLARAPQHLLVDGLEADIPGFPQTALVKGDSRSYSIAAASVIAKVTRDRLMRQLHEAHPGYAFDQHKGYGTRAHLDALARLGPCEIHRRSFAPCARQGALL